MEEERQINIGNVRKLIKAFSGKNGFLYVTNRHGAQRYILKYISLDRRNWILHLEGRPITKNAKPNELKDAQKALQVWCVDKEYETGLEIRVLSGANKSLC